MYSIYIRLSDNKRLFKALVQTTEFLNWKKNREPDLERINEILQEYRNEHYQFIPGYVTVFQENNQYYIIDGMHRYSAAKMYSETDFPNIEMDVCVIETNEPNILLKEFQILNKNVPPPDYLMNAIVSPENQQICTDIVNWLSSDYKEHCMVSKKPKIPNFRKDDLNNTLYEILPNGVTYEQVKKQILELNEEVKENYKDKALKKCEKSGFYIMYDPEWSSKLRNRLIL